MNTVDEIFKKYNWPTRPNPPNDTNFVDIENEIGFQLPEDYKTFLSKYVEHEATIGKEFFRLWDKESLISVNREYEIFEYLPGTLGIGSNGSGELIAIEKLDGGRLRIVLTPFIGLDKQDHIKVGDSFSDFILSMDEGHDWFGD